MEAAWIEAAEAAQGERSYPSSTGAPLRRPWRAFQPRACRQQVAALREQRPRWDSALRRHAWTLLRRPNPCRRLCPVEPLRQHRLRAERLSEAAKERPSRRPEAEAAPRPREVAEEASSSMQPEAAWAAIRVVAEVEAMKVHLVAAEAELPSVATACLDLAWCLAEAAAERLHCPAAAVAVPAQCHQAACPYELHPPVEEVPFPASCCEDPSSRVLRRRPNRCPYHRPCSATPQEIAALTANDGTHPSHISRHASRGSVFLHEQHHRAHGQRKKMTRLD